LSPIERKATVSHHLAEDFAVNSEDLAALYYLANGQFARREE
jgi:hypothetical protein